MTLRPGSVLANYAIEEQIGTGGMGAVYRARHLGLKRVVALKVLHNGLSADRKVRKTFEREAELVARLDHPHIVAIYDCSLVEDEALWLSMRHIGGGDLTQALAGAPGGLDPDRVMRLIGDTARALDYAHGQGVLHRDIKPHNILIESVADGERAVLTDFGIARALDDTVTASSVSATFAYAAPERFTNAHAVDHRADVYSLGCTLFQLLTGRVPFVADNPGAAINAHLHTAPPSPRDLRPDLPSFLDSVIATALAKDVEDRYPTCTALVSDLQRALTSTTYAPIITAVEPASQQDRASWLRDAADSGDLDAMTELAGLLRREGEVEEAEAWYRHAAENNHTEAMYQLARLLKEEGWIEEAETWYRRAADDNHALAAYDLGEWFRRQDREEEAIPWFRRAAENGLVGAMHTLGFLLHRHGQDAEAETWYRRAVENGDTIFGVGNLGRMLTKQGRIAEAETWYRRAGIRGDVSASFDLAELLREQGRAAEAEPWYRRASGNYRSAARHLGDLLQEQNRIAEAETWYRRAAEGRGLDRDPEAMKSLAALLEKQGRTAEAETWNRRAESR